MKYIKTKDAVGQMLCHDITQIIPNVSKGPVFKKGHIITEEDIEVLLSVGKENIYVWENDETMMHENEAAEVLCGLCINQYMNRTQPSEGKIEITAAEAGLLKIDREKLKLVNGFGQMMIATRHANFPVQKGDKLAGTRIIPLIIEKEKMEKIKELCGNEPILTIKPFVKKRVAVFTTGSEVYHHRIEDAFTPVIVNKLKEYGSEVVEHQIFDDNDQTITQAIIEVIKDKKVDMVLCTGGMSVDPDDRTPLAIKNTKADIVTYGVPTLPGAMFMLAYLNQIPIVGLPGCVMYAKRTVFDLVLPRLLANDVITNQELISLGEGGLCLNCPVCTYPNCGFGKGK